MKNKNNIVMFFKSLFMIFFFSIYSICSANQNVIEDVTPEEEQAFNELLEQKVPMSTDQIIEFRKAIEESKAAAMASPNSPPRPTITTQVINLSTGSTPPVIRLAKGFVTTIVLLDSTGSPWPIKGYDLGNPGAFSIQWDKKSNIMMIQAKDVHEYGNLVIQLHDLNAPISLSLLTSQRDVDYRVDFRVPGYGPNAKYMPLSDGSLISESNELLKVLDGIAPIGSNDLEVDDDGVSAWQYNNKIYVRTKYTIVSPAWLSSINSADDTHAYELTLTPVLSISYQGRVKQVKLEGIDYGR